MYDPRKSPDDFLLLVSICSMTIGLALLCIGYIIPREYVFDSSLPAKEMEAIELYHVNLTKALDICIIVGMGFTAFGGILIASLITYSFIDNPKPESDKHRMISSKIEMKSYWARGTDHD